MVWRVEDDLVVRPPVCSTRAKSIRRTWASQTRCADNATTGMKEIFPICKDSRRLVSEHLLNDGNNVLLILVLVFEHQQPTARSESQRSMLEVPAFTFGLPSLCLARGRMARRPQGSAYSASLYTNDIPYAPYLQGPYLPAPEFGAVMTVRSTASLRRTGEAD